MLFDENFTFDCTTPRSPSLSGSDITLSTSTRDTSRAVSPCTTAYPQQQPRFSVTDLAASIANTRLRQDSQIWYDSCEAYANLEDDDGWEVPALSRTRTQPQRAYSPGRRMARQLNTRLLCSSSHAKDIAALVEQMVERKEHCNVSESTMIRNDVDEGYDSGSGSNATSRRSSLAVQRSRMDHRRTSDMKAGGARVCKAVRQKKDLLKCRRVRRGENGE